jgi:hypothetical protein
MKVTGAFNRVTNRTARKRGLCSLPTILLLVLVSGGIVMQFNQSFTISIARRPIAGGETAKSSAKAMSVVNPVVSSGGGGGFGSCTPGTSSVQKDIVIDGPAIRALPKTRLQELIGFTDPRYEKHMMNAAGREHYTLLEYMTATYGDCRHVVDIGTRFVASSLALGSHETEVWTFDLPRSTERILAFRGKTEAEWKQQVKAAKVDIKLHNLDLIKVSDAEFRKYMSTWLIMLDTHHKPYTIPFEREWMDRLVKMADFKGLVLLDDIHHNAEMKRWWNELKEKANEWGYTTYDLTSVGHVSGTGLLDFSGRVKIVA